jgi:hypothetical protein
MTLTDVFDHDLGGSPPVPVGPEPGPASKRRRPFYLATGLVAVLAGVVLVLVLLAASYQPLGFGGAEGDQFPGLPAAVGIRSVNNFAALGDRYVPPKRGEFAILESLENLGSRSVTVEAVTVRMPGQVASWPLVMAGRVLYMPGEYQHGERVWNSGRPVEGLSLAPNEDVWLGIPLRMAYSCYVNGGTAGQDAFYVEEKFLTFTHWVTIRFAAPLLMREPEPASSGTDGLVCLP